MTDERREECALHADEVVRSHRALLEKMDAIEKRLFRDNGTLSIQTRIERHEQILKVLLWVTSIVVGAVLTSGVMGLIVLFKWAIRNGAAL
jgi:hypothetical protein